MPSSVSHTKEQSVSNTNTSGELKSGAWADVEGEAAMPLRRAFLDGRVFAEAAYGGREFLFDFLWMVRIDAGTAEEVAMGWIDDRGACFFPVPKSGRKRKRGEPELEDGASSGVDERSGESSDTVESSIQPNPLPLSSTPRAAGLPRVGGGVAITAVHKVLQGPRSRVFQMQGQLLAAARGTDEGNAKFAWYGAPSADVAAAVEYGFGRMNSQCEDAATAMDNMDGVAFFGCILTVNYAFPEKIKGGEQGWAAQPV
ncbi:hypothetical protein TRIUR3_18056 [Triticum urartu]|uniref:RCD1 WWE domain-containing protein n=1 Tax=Triticum urartu TaxID=4572 RepID=M7Z0H7_TRIUA|nr:hypothetical protein TRIUR3_18056 [Triticum urartu]